MPEITEVLITSQFLLHEIKNSYISKINILSGRYTKQQMVGLDIFKKNTLCKIINIETKGKLMWITLKKESKMFYLICNFGLTGEWSFEKKNNARVEFELSHNNVIRNLYFVDQLNFGVIMITDDKKILENKINKLARDYIKEPFTDDEFYNAITQFKKQDKMIIKVLMEQDVGKTIGSGIGNYIAVESLYDAKISPYRLLNSLSKTDIINLNKAIKKIIKISYMSNKIGYMKNFENYIDIHKEQVKQGLFPNYFPEIKIKKNEMFEFKVYKQKQDKFNNPVKADKIIPGRTTYWVPNIQK